MFFPIFDWAEKTKPKMKVEDILCADEIATARLMVSQLRGNSANLGDAIKIGKQKFDEWIVNARPQKRNKPGNYIAMDLADAKKVQALIGVDDEMAVGFFCYRAKYPGKDAYGEDAKNFELNKKGMMSESSKLRSNAHYVDPCDRSPFDLYCVEQRKRGKPQGWFYFAIPNAAHCYTAIEAGIIETFEFMFRNVDENVDNAYRFEILAYFIDCAMRGNFVDDTKVPSWVKNAGNLHEKMH